MLVKLALGNVRRSLRDFSVYFLTLAFAACLLYSFLASNTYLLALDLTEMQRLAFAKAGGVLQAFAVFIDVIFVFLLGYANAFLLRRRKREFGMYLLLGLRPRHVSWVLALESAVVGVVALVAGLALGLVLSPAFGLVAAFVFGVTWQPVFTFSTSAATTCAISFAVITFIAAVVSVRGIWKRPLIELMQADRAPERRLLAGARSVRIQGIAAAILLAFVWGACLFSPGYFIVLIIPMGFIALGGTYFLFRVLSVRVPERLRRRATRYWTGLMPFTVRSVEARAESGCMALAAECVLLAASMCMTVAGLAFSVGLRTGTDAAGADALASIAFACVFYGAAFLIAAAAILALQQLSQASDAIHGYRTLAVLGTPVRLMRGSLRIQVGASFATPTLMACVHCIFGFSLIGLLSLLMGAADFALFAGGTVVFTLVVLGLYYLVTIAVCERTLVSAS